MELLGGVLRFVFIFLLPGEVLLNIARKESEENTNHEGVVNDADPGKSFGNEIEGIDQIQEPQTAADQGAGRPLTIAAGEQVAEHGGAGTDQAGEVGQLRAGAEGVHVLLTMLNDRAGNEEFDGDED